jgi:hypothetical protein
MAMGQYPSKDIAVENLLLPGHVAGWLDKFYS